MDDRYAAGIFDGEGCVLINKRVLKASNEIPQYNLKISITATYLPMLEAMQQTYGGSVQAVNNKVNKPLYSWALSTNGSIAFLTRVYPYLMEKKAQAWLALEYHAQRTHNSATYRVSPEEVALREGYFLALKQAKGRDN